MTNERVKELNGLRVAAWFDHVTRKGAAAQILVGLAMLDGDPNYGLPVICTPEWTREELIEFLKNVLASVEAR